MDAEHVDRRQRLLQYLQTDARESVMAELLRCRDPDLSRCRLNALLQATACMSVHLRKNRGQLTSDEAHALTERALEQLAKQLEAIDTCLSDREHGALFGELERFFAYLRRCATNRDGSADLGALGAHSSTVEPEPEPEWRALEARIAFIDAKLRHGEAFSAARIKEVFEDARVGPPPRRDQALSNSLLARLLGLSLEGFETLLTTRPSPAALNELHRHTGYVERSIGLRAAEHAGEPALAALTIHGEPILEADVDALDFDDHFKELMRKFLRMKD